MNAKMFLSTLALTSACIASAKTTTWTGGATGKAGTAKSFLAAANWDNGVPEPGDTVVINASTAWDNPVYIGHEAGSTDTAETFDIGSAGLTFDISSAYTKLLVNFTGSGKITKIGTGMLGVACASAFTGGVEVKSGKIASWKENTRLSFGTAAIRFIADGTTPGLSSNTYGAGFANTLEFSGDSADYTAYSGGQLFLAEALSSTHDLTFKPSSYGMSFRGAVSAPGNTLTFWPTRDATKSAVQFTFAAAVDANIVAKGNMVLNLNGNSANPDHSLEIQDGTCVIGANAVWGGDVVLSGSATNLTLKGSANLSPSANISIADGCTAKLYITGSVSVKSLSVGEVPVEDGLYTAANLPAVIGSGTLVVSSTKRTTWIGPVTGGTSSSPVGGTPQSRFDPANWDNGVPVAGDTIVITNAGSWNKEVYIGPGAEQGQDSFNLGSAGLTVETTLANTRVRFGLPFVGSGKIVKLGPGFLGAEVDSSHSGGTLIMEGVFESYRSATLRFGTAPIEFHGTGSGVSRIQTDLWGCTLANALSFMGTSGSNIVISSGQPYTFGGNILAEHDISFSGTYGPITFNGTVSAPGKTITVTANRAKDDTLPNFTFNQAVTGSVVKNGNRTLTFQAASGGADDSLTVNGGTVAINAAAAWGGTNVVVGASAVALVLNGDGNLSPEAVLDIDTTGGAKISIASGVKVKIAKLHVNGITLRNGVYSAKNLPEALSGGGKLKVGTPGYAIVIR